MKCPFVITVTLVALMPHVLAALARMRFPAAFPFHAFAKLSFSVSVSLAAFAASMFAVLTAFIILNFYDRSLHRGGSREGFHCVSWGSQRGRGGTRLLTWR